VRYFLASIGLLLAAALPAQAQDAGPYVQARLVSEDSAVPPDGAVTIALVEDIQAGWHTYWVNPGDAGAATEIKWTLPQGWGAGAIQWPTPKRLPVGPLMDYGYEGQPWLLQKLTIPANAKAGDTVTLKAAVDWLVCKDVCVPEDATLNLPLKIGPAAIDPALTKDFATARSLMPVASPWTLTYSLGKTLDLYAAAPALAAAHPVEASFFSEKTDVVDGDAKQTLDFTKDGLILHLAPASKVAKIGGALTGVLVLKSSDGSIQALTVNAPPGSVPGAITGSDASVAGASVDITLWVAILSAFIGGLILNAMPCVLPILAMKALALAKHSGGEHKEAAREGSAYSAGAILSFLVLGLVIVVLRQSGAAVGWGFQLQEPVAVAGFALLIFAVGLNLSGVFEVGSITMGDSLAARSGALGAFFTGVLAVAVAAPCTAPFMAAALGFALMQSALSAMLIFFSLGIGFALPFLILGLWPRALSFLPKPGTWMLRLKQFLAFPMYGAAAWLTWVLAQEAGPNGVLVLLAAMVALSLAAWLWGVTRNLSNAGRGIGVAAALMVVAAILYGLTTLSGTTAAPPATAASAAAEGFTDAKLAALRASGQPVFVDATAAWCITCLVNEKAALSRASVKDAFAQRHIAYLVADWTARDAAITRLLGANGRSGVPLYLYYPPGADKPIILPQILTEAGILAAIGS
jgi:thiol:disulfide interchange protein/DsbC/DsbD-like thiol-disulfide interchange protein